MFAGVVGFDSLTFPSYSKRLKSLLYVPVIQKLLQLVQKMAYRILYNVWPIHAWVAHPSVISSCLIWCVSLLFVCFPNGWPSPYHLLRYIIHSGECPESEWACSLLPCMEWGKSLYLLAEDNIFSLQSNLVFMWLCNQFVHLHRL